MKVRHIQKQELPQVAEMYAECMNNAGIGEAWTKQTAKIYLEWFYNQKPDLFFVAINDEEITGALAALLKPYFHGNILIEPELFVHARFRNQGVGKILLIKLLEYAIKTYDIVDISAYADKNATFPLEWYKRLGFEESFWIHIGANPIEVLKKLKA
jgi:GNAT superfamily N-acetyltransferase